MRNPESVTLESAIIHRLDTRRESPPEVAGLRLSPEAFLFDADPPLEKFLTDHIANSLKDSAAQAALFTSAAGEIVCDTCRELHENRVSLVEGSQAIAQHLYSIMERDQRINAGVLAVCFYRATYAGESSRYLALLKLDLGEIYRTTTIPAADGSEIIGLMVDPNAVTSTRERLQKSAFIRPLDPRAPDFDMILLDRQVQRDRQDNTDDPTGIAKFFINAFLKASPAFDATQRTKRFYRGVVKAQNELRDLEQIDDDQDDTLTQAVEDVLTSTAVNVETWIANLPLPSAITDTVRRFVADEQSETEFSPDERYVRQKIRRRRFSGDHGLRISVEADGLKNGTMTWRKVDIDGQRITEVTIRTRRWVELPE